MISKEFRNITEFIWKKLNLPSVEGTASFTWTDRLSDGGLRKPSDELVSGKSQTDQSVCPADSGGDKTLTEKKNQNGKRSINLNISLYSTRSLLCEERFKDLENELTQNIVNKINNRHKIVILGDLNARIGNEEIPGVNKRFNEGNQRKYTFNNTRGQRSTIDFIITNRVITPSQVLDVRGLTSANIGTDHNLILCNILLERAQTARKTPQYIEKYNTESLASESTRTLFESRLTNKLQGCNMAPDWDVEGILKNKLEEHIENREAQQAFRRKRSTTDAIFIVKQIKEKVIEFNTPAYTGIPVLGGIRQGDSLSPSLFNVLIDTIIEAVTSLNLGYRINKRISMIRNADDAAITAENEDDLQRQLFSLYQISQRLHMTISINKTKSMTIAREPVGCKLAIENKIVEKVLQFKYIGIDLSSSHDPVKDLRIQINKAAAVSGYLREIAWANQYMRTESKVKIYKTCVRTIMTYGLETRKETNKTKDEDYKNVEKTTRDRVRNTDIREQCGVQDVVR
ncbi:hypothetical protein HUJ05_001700 [Dendroctonus ponderosae]|nr:hypothetical protein HUJ05_001700 [Dendroctonus ponderosae]